MDMRKMMKKWKEKMEMKKNDKKMKRENGNEKKMIKQWKEKMEMKKNDKKM